VNPLSIRRRREQPREAGQMPLHPIKNSSRLSALVPQDEPTFRTSALSSIESQTVHSALANPTWLLTNLTSEPREPENLGIFLSGCYRPPTRLDDESGTEQGIDPSILDRAWILDTAWSD